MVVFIRIEDKEKIIQKLYTGRGSEYRQVEGMRVKDVQLQPDTLLYTWGSAKDGKLGISKNYTSDFDNGALSHFYIDDKIEQNSDDFEQFVANKNLNIHDLSPEKIEKLKNLMEFESRTIFTVKPQPVVTLMGTELSKIVCGNDHVLVLTQDHKLYSWGSNEKGQLGIDQKDTLQKTEFVTYSVEDNSTQDSKKKDQDGQGGILVSGEKNSGESEEKGNKGVNFAMSPRDDKGLTKQTKIIDQYYMGVPTQIKSILGKIDDISCGDQNSFAIVKI